MEREKKERDRGRQKHTERERERDLAGILPMIFNMLITKQNKNKKNKNHLYMVEPHCSDGNL